MANKPYGTHYYCAQCSRWIPKPEAKQGHCPSCGKKLRTRPRMYGKRRLKTSTLAMNATPFQTLHSASGFPPRSVELPVAESIIKPAKQKLPENSCSFNVESRRNMEGWKK